MGVNLASIFSLLTVHAAKNQFSVISLADLGSPEDGSIVVGRIVPATTDRFNSFSPIWGRLVFFCFVE